MMQARTKATPPFLEKLEGARLYLQHAWQQHPFRCALLASLCIHLIFLSFHWGMGAIQIKRLNTPLSVVLVNASHPTPPRQASKLAQADLQGGGIADDRDATAVHRASLGTQARLEVLEKQQQQMLAKLNAEQARARGGKTGEEQKLAAQLNALEAELAKELQVNGRKPRHLVLTGASTKSVSFAHYYDAMRQKIEAYGSAYFPRANGHPLYGSLVIVVSIDAQGRITTNATGQEGLSIGRSSGNVELDRQALAIVRASAPFGPFPLAMRNQIDVLDWVSTFDFSRDNADRLELKR